MKFNNRIKYSEETCKLVLSFIDKNLSVEEISNRVNIPATTIRNWKLGYVKVYGTNKKLNSKNKDKIENLVNQGYSIREIFRTLNMSYNAVRLFLKKTMTNYDYEQIKIMDHKIPKEAYKLTKELAYILGVMLGDGYFARYQIRLDVIDKEFRDYFAQVSEKWSHKKPSLREFQNNKSYFFGCILCSKSAHAFLRYLKNNKKILLNNILNSNSEEIKTSLIKGFSDSEGSIVKDHRLIRIYNTDKELLENIKQLLINLGFDDNKMHIRLSTDKTYELGIKSHKNIKLFYQKIGFTIKRKQVILENFINKLEGGRREFRLKS